MSPATSSARSTPAMRSRSSSRPCRARPTSSSPGRGRPPSLHDAREYDAVVASGEQVTSGLLAIALQDIGVNARSWQGWQIPIHTDAAHGAARIVDDRRRDADRAAWRSGQVAVIAGFQGIGPDNRIATLGRGGSDTSAVAIAAADRRRALRHLHRRRRRLHDRPAHRAEGAAARQGLLRGDAGDGLARRQGPAGALGRARHGARGADFRALQLRRPRSRRCWSTATSRPERSSATRKRSWKRRSSPASPIRRTRRRFRCAASPTSRASPPACSGRWPRPTSTST